MSREIGCWRSAVAPVIPCNIRGNAMHLTMGSGYIRKTERKSKATFDGMRPFGNNSLELYST